MGPQGPHADSSSEEWAAAELKYRNCLQEFQECEEVDAPLDVGADLRRAVSEMFARADEVRVEANHARVVTEDGVPPVESEPEGSAGESDSDPWDGTTNDDQPHAANHPVEDELLEELNVKLFPDGRVSRLGATIYLLCAFKVAKAPNSLINEVFKLLHEIILPQGNTLPCSEKEATRMLRKLGLVYDSIHCCPHNCVLFRGNLVDATVCPKCNANRFVRRSVPAKVLRHFPIIPRVKRMFSIKEIAELFCWHHFNKSKDGLMRHPADSPQWANVDMEFPEFGSEPRNLRVFLSVDGVNPFGIKNCKWSCTPVVMTIANLPPWCMTKFFFMSLCLLIPGKEAVKGSEFDVFFEPLLEELKELWFEGVRMRDASGFLGQHNFTCRLVVLCTAHDLPGLGIVAGCTTKGYMGCPHCGPGTISRYSKSLKKIVYDSQHRRWLPEDHPFRFADSIFDGAVEHEVPPPEVQPSEVLEWARERKAFLDGGGKPKRVDPSRRTGIKRASTLYSLPYWEVREI